MPYSSVTLRSVKGSTLTNAEVDNNFYNLNEYKVEKDDAVSANTALKVVKRDSSGNFATNKITLNTGITLGVSDTPSNVFTLYNNYDGTIRLAVNGLNNALDDVIIFNGLCKLEFPVTSGSSGNVLVTDGNGQLSWTSSANISISGSAASVDNGLYSTGSYYDPDWLKTLAPSKVLPTLGGNAGKYLTTDGSGLIWREGTAPVIVSNNLPLSNSLNANAGTSIEASRANHIHPVFPLTISTGLSGNSYNGTGSVTIANTGVLSLSGGATGLTPSVATTGNVVLGGVLTMANGGTGSSLSAPTPGSLLYITSNRVEMTPVGVQGQVLLSGASGAPTWADSSVNVQSDRNSTGTQYLMFTQLITGGLRNAKVNDDVTTPLTYVPSSGTLRAKYFSGDGSNLTGTTSSSFNIGGNAATTTKLQSSRTITLSGAVTGSVGFDGSESVSITTTPGSNQITLGSHTSGNYVKEITATAPINITNATSAGSTPVISITTASANTPSAIVARDASGDFSTNSIQLSGRLIAKEGIANGIRFLDGATGDTASITLEQYGAGAEDTKMIFKIGNDTKDVFEFIAPSSVDGLLMNGNKVWHSGNDGSGTGLDADTVDGYQVTTTPENSDATSLIKTDSSGQLLLKNLLISNISGGGNQKIEQTPLNIWGSDDTTNHLRSYKTSSFVAQQAASLFVNNTNYYPSSLTNNSSVNSLVRTDSTGKVDVNALKVSGKMTYPGAEVITENSPARILGASSDGADQEIKSFATANLTVATARKLTGGQVTVTGVGLSGNGNFDSNGNVTVNLTGTVTNVTNSTTADRLSTARTIGFTGGISGSGSFDGSSNITISTTIGSVPAGNISGTVANATNAGTAVNWSGAASASVASAGRLTTSRTISLTGTGITATPTSFDGTGNISIPVVLTYLDQPLKTTSNAPTFGKYGNHTLGTAPTSTTTGLIVESGSTNSLMGFKTTLTGGTFGINLNQKFVWHIGTLLLMGLSNVGELTTTGSYMGSDLRLKTNLEVIPNALDKINQVSGYTFDLINIKTSRKTGVIAQEIEKILPEAVSEDENGMKSVAYGNIVGILIEAIKELNAKVEKLETQLALNSL